MRKFIDSLEARKAAAKDESGFSLIDVVVTIAIIVALTLGGLIAYTGLVDSAKQASVAAAADQVYTAAVVEYNNGGTEADIVAIGTDYTASSNGNIEAVVTVNGADIQKPHPTGSSGLI